MGTRSGGNGGGSDGSTMARKIAENRLCFTPGPAVGSFQMRPIFSLAQQLETLESRTLLTVTLSGGVLTITGGAGNDVLAMSQVKSTVFVSSNGHKAPVVL